MDVCVAPALLSPERCAHLSGHPYIDVGGPPWRAHASEMRCFSSGLDAAGAGGQTVCRASVHARPGGGGGWGPALTAALTDGRGRRSAWEAQEKVHSTRRLHVLRPRGSGWSRMCHSCGPQSLLPLERPPPPPPRPSDGSDGEEQYNTDVSDTRLGRVMGSDSDGFSTDISDSRKRRRKEGGSGKEARTYPAREGASGALGLL